MGKAKLVAASDPGDAFTEFTGVTRLKQGISPAGVYVDRPPGDGPSPNLSRSATTPSLSSKPPGDSGLGRAKTTLNTSSNAPMPADTPPSIGRSNTQIAPAKPSAAASIGGPVRGLSVRRQEDTPPAPPAKPGERFTEFYDDYLDSYGDAPPLPSNGPPDRVADWARTNANPNYPPGRGPSRSNSSYAPSSFGGGSVRRKVTRRVTRGPSSRFQGAYEEDEEGYVSGEYDDGPFELVKIRVKLHYQGDTRGMALAPEIMFEEFMDKVTAKFGKDINGLSLKFKDEDGGKVSLRDESDYELAIETARESAKGKPEGKLEIWCSDV